MCTPNRSFPQPPLCGSPTPTYGDNLHAKAQVRKMGTILSKLNASPTFRLGTSHQFYLPNIEISLKYPHFTSFLFYRSLSHGLPPEFFNLFLHFKWSPLLVYYPTYSRSNFSKIQIPSMVLLLYFENLQWFPVFFQSLVKDTDLWGPEWRGRKSWPHSPYFQPLGESMPCDKRWPRPPHHPSLTAPGPGSGGRWQCLWWFVFFLYWRPKFILL